MRRFCFGVLVALVLALCAPAARAQGVPIPSDSYGFCYNLAVPQTISASCTVTFFDQGTSNLSTGLYQNEGLTIPFTNPGTAGTNGTWRVYVAASSTQAYDIRISGGLPAVTPYTILNVSPGGSGGGGGSVKPSSAAGIVFVSNQGNDTNDCLSWGSSCLTLLGGYNKLPTTGGTIYVTSGLQSSGPACTPTSGQGLGIAGPNDPNYASMPEAIGSMYWVKAKAAFSGVSIVGVSANASNANSTVGAVTPVNCGGSSAPAFQFSDVEGYTLQNLAMSYPKQGVLIQVDSNGDSSGTVTAGSNIVLENLVINICNSCGATPGPTIWVGGNLIWARMSNLALQGNPNNTSAEGRAAILVQTNAGAASLLLHMDRINSTNGGNFVWANDQTVGTGTFDIDQWTMEGSSVATPIVNVESAVGIYSGDIKGLQLSDAASAPWVHIPSNVPPFYTHIHPGLGQDAVTVDGPADVLGTMRMGSIGAVTKVGGVASANVAPQAYNDMGYPLGRLTVQADAQRRQFQSFARFTNLASQLPGTWTTTSGFVTVTTGQTAPDTTTNAAKVATSSSGGAIAYDTTPTFNPGDYLYIGVWAREASTGGINSSQITDSALCLCFPFGSGPTIKLLAGSYLSNAGQVLAASGSPQTDGEWQYLWAVGKVTGGFGASGTRLQLQASSPNTPMTFYAPVFAKIPASTFALVSAPSFSSGSESGNTVTFVTTGAHGLTAGEPVVISGCTPSGYNGEYVISATPLTTSFQMWNTTTGLGAASGCTITPGNDSEAADWGLNAATWSDNAPANTLAGPRGLRTSFGASANNFWGTLSHANTANRVYTFPDAALTVVGEDTTQTLTNKTLLDTTTTFANTSTPSKTMKLDLAGASAASQATFAFTHTTARTYTFPDRTGTVCVTGASCATQSYDCGTMAACSPSLFTTTKIFIGDATLVSSTPSTVTITGLSPAYSSSSSYHCVASNQTSNARNDLQITYVSGSSFTITGGNSLTDVLHYICIGQ